MFTRTPKKPLKQAIALVDQAFAIADAYRRDNEYTPNSEDLSQLDALRVALWTNHCTLEYILKNLASRTPNWEQSKLPENRFAELG